MSLLSQPHSVRINQGLGATGVGFFGSLDFATKSVSKGTVRLGFIFGIACYGSGSGFGFICIGLL
jgi:hypothetical protein